MTDEELIARLHKIACHMAADRIEALVNEAVLNKAAYDGLASLLLSVQQDYIKERQRADSLESELNYANKRIEHAFERIECQARTIDDLIQRAKRLEAAASAVVEDVCSYICPSVGKAGVPIPHDSRCTALRDELE